MSNTVLTELSTRIKFVRECKNISKSELARRLFISPAYVTALESGEKTKISAPLAKLIQHEFGVNMEWLLEGRGDTLLPERNKKTIIPDNADDHEEEQGEDLSTFERLLSEISATYINLPINQLEKVLRDDFRRLTQALGFDACIIYISDDPPGKFTKIRPYVWYIDESLESNRLILNWYKSKNIPTIDSKDLRYTFEVWNRGESIVWVDFDHCPKEAAQEELYAKQLGLKSVLGIPLSFAGHIWGIISVATSPVRRTWPDTLISRIRLLGEVFINAIMRKKTEEQLCGCISEIQQLKEQFESDYLYLREEIKGDHEGVVGKSNALKNIFTKVRQVAHTNATVLILGETGTGKGLIARSIHDSSIHMRRPLMQVNCAALAPSIIESELFGHEKGAFTGAAATRLGRFEAAKGTTLFLDEIGELPLELQPKLLRVLEEGEFERVGGNNTIHTDIRLIAATSKDLEKEVAASRFRSDLWYRLNIFPIFVPPLRERLEDIPLLVEHFIRKYQKWTGKKFRTIPSEAISALQSYSWPGNIRELSNVIERAVITSHDGNLRFEIPAPHKNSTANGNNFRQDIENIERVKIIKALEESDWVIGGKNGAANRLGFTPSTLRYRTKKLNIKRPKFPRTESYAE